ncbi:MAG: zinc-binding dehydrogenase, partial [Acidimicrobiia bacterium]|nr:zinc-binding dehydrogenase [Acidimicrobiia bacterium]
MRLRPWAGASRAIGTAAIQVAKHLGARVTGVCSTSEVELVESLGADRVIDDTQADFTTSGEVYDVIFDAESTSSFLR